MRPQNWDRQTDARGGRRVVLPYMAGTCRCLDSVYFLAPLPWTAYMISSKSVLIRLWTRPRQGTGLQDCRRVFSNRDLQTRRQRQRQRHKTNAKGSMSKNNRSARAFELLVLFSAVLCKRRHEMTKFKVLMRTWTQHGEFSFSHQSTANAQMQVILVHVFWTLRAQFFLSHILATFTDSKGLPVFFLGCLSWIIIILPKWYRVCHINWVERISLKYN